MIGQMLGEKSLPLFMRQHSFWVNHLMRAGGGGGGRIFK